MSMRRLPRDKPCLPVPGPALVNGKIPDHAERGFATELAGAIGMRVSILLPDVATGQAALQHPPVQRLGEARRKSGAPHFFQVATAQATALAASIHSRFGLSTQRRGERVAAPWPSDPDLNLRPAA